MGISAVKYKILPESLEVDLDELKEKCKSVISENNGNVSDIEEDPIAFGLKALIISFAFPEEREIDEIGNKLSEVEGVSSVEMIDYRRAVG